MKGKGILLVAGALALAAAAAWARPGSVISSFQGFLGFMPTGVYRDADYVYVVNLGESIFNYATKHTPTGSYVGGPEFVCWRRYVPEDPDHSYLGSSYISIAAEAGIITYPKGGGNYVRWDHYDLIETVSYGYRPGGNFYYVGVIPENRDDVFITYCFNTRGSLINSFAPAYAGDFAATDRFAGVSGEYLIIGHGAVYTPRGSLVATFAHLAGCSLRGATAGPGYPASWGTTLWVLGSWGINNHAVFQLDLGNGSPSAIIPASIGKVKALFR